MSKKKKKKKPTLRQSIDKLTKEMKRLNDENARLREREILNIGGNIAGYNHCACGAPKYPDANSCSKYYDA